MKKKFNWTYVSVVYSDTEYGNNGYDLLTTAAARYNICLSSPQAINVERFRQIDYDNLITTLMHKINARVVIVYTDPHVARKIMKAAKRRLNKNGGRLDRFIWIASDAWCCRDFVVHGLEPVVEGTISVTPLHYPLGGFADYFRSLRPDFPAERNRLNPWFREFWERHFRCKLMIDESLDNMNIDSGTTTLSTDSESESKESPDMAYCNQSLKLDVTEHQHYQHLQQSPSLHFVRDAFYSFAMTLNHIHQNVCNGTAGLCDEMKELIISGEYMIEQLKKVQFRDEGGRLFRFQNNGDAPPRYTIVNFQRLSNGSYQWRPVGNYIINENDNKVRLKLEMKLLQFKHDMHRFPKSFCSEPCTKGQAKLQLEGDTCCWLCTNCSQYQYLLDEFHCEECPLGTIPDVNKTKCHLVPTIYLSWTEWWTISAIIFAITGMLATISTWIVFFCYAETPIIKASGRELSNLHLSGIFLSFAATFVILAKPTPLTCGLTRFFLGFCYTICYAAIVTKTNRISRIFTHRSCQKPKFTSPQSQLVITFLLISVQILINIFWFFHTPPDIKLVYSNREIAWLICSRSDHLSYLISLIYPFILIGFCTVYAFKTRKCPEGFNEARYITFTNYTTCVVWFAFLPLYVMLSTTTPLRAITLSSLLSVSGAVQLCCLFVPKMYIALLKPEKNTRETVMCGGHRSLVFNMPVAHHRHHHHHHHHNHNHNHHHRSNSHEMPKQRYHSSRPSTASTDGQIITAMINETIDHDKNNNNIDINTNVANGNSIKNSTNTSKMMMMASNDETSTIMTINNIDCNGSANFNDKQVIMIEPYSISSDIDTTTTALTAISMKSMNITIPKNNDNHSLRLNDSRLKRGSIASMPDKLSISEEKNDCEAGNNENSIIYENQISIPNEKHFTQRSQSACAAIITNGKAKNEFHSSLSSSLSSTTSSTSNSSSNQSNSSSMSLIVSPSSIQSPLNNDLITIKKHNTKAVLKHAHKCWPSIHLDDNLSSPTSTINDSTNNSHTQTTIVDDTMMNND
ncbi:metabotropic glutamate receptor 2-like isoform X2 [Dermatophagoides pteronyssinus]|uniref:metabotropic glutamate receptor 2-like isoform X2 n=1 Tax=Dermatophagoides pteronyssinus TaxID=6956 RepID=UPI003F66F491